MARILALCLLLIGLAIQIAPAMAGAVPVIDDAAAMEAMTDCPDCEAEAMARHGTCEIVGGCVAMTAALDPGAGQTPFDPGMRALHLAFGDDASVGARPTPPFEPPRFPA